MDQHIKESKNGPNSDFNRSQVLEQIVDEIIAFARKTKGNDRCFWDSSNYELDYNLKGEVLTLCIGCPQCGSTGYSATFDLGKLWALGGPEKKFGLAALLELVLPVNDSGISSKKTPPSKISWKETKQGYLFGEFLDRNNQVCSIQESSLATEEAIWLGVDNPPLKLMVEGKGWQEIPLPPGFFIFSRMHLTRETARELLGPLQHFVETGNLPEPTFATNQPDGNQDQSGQG